MPSDADAAKIGRHICEVVGLGYRYFMIEPRPGYGAGLWVEPFRPPVPTPDNSDRVAFEAWKRLMQRPMITPERTGDAE